MYSVEMDHDEIKIVIMDEHGFNEDLVFNIFDDIVFLRQYNEELDTDMCLSFSPEMWEDLMAAIHSPEGLFKQNRKKLISK